MRILHVTESHEAAAGGVTTVVTDLATHLVGSGADVGIFSVGNNPLPPPPGVSAWNSTPNRWFARWGWHPRLRDRLAEVIRKFKPSVIHLHGAWLAPQIFAARMAIRQRVPFIVSFHGMLEPYHWSDRGWIQLLRKRGYWSVASRSFSHASAVHAITPLEAQHFKRWLPGIQAIVIPNSVDLSLIERRLGALPRVSAEKRIAFLGRLHPKKGVDLLIRAFDQASLGEPWQLNIVGPDWDPTYTLRLKSIAHECASASRIHFLGSRFGDDRLNYLRESWVVVVPSHSEVVGIVNLEAAACKTPSITSRATGLLDWAEGGGELIDLSIDAIASAVGKYAALSETERMRKGEKSFNLVRDRYSWTTVWGKWLALYERAASQNETAA